ELGRTQAVATLAVTVDGSSELLLKDLAEEFQEQMLLHPEIPLVSIEGFSQRELRIRLSADALRRYGLSVQQVAQKLSAYNKSLPLGTLLTRYKEYDLRFDDERVTPQQLQQLVILSGASGEQVTLSDIASVDEHFELPEQHITFDGLPAALLKVEKNTDQDSLRVLAAMQEFMEEKQRQLPTSVKLYITQDMTSLIIDRLSMLISNAWQGLILVFLTLLLFFNLRYSFWVVMGLPVSFMASFFLMSFVGVSINMISMVSLLLALGILMDDAIVISESIASHYKAGHTPLNAAISGVKRVGRGVLSSFATTVLIFGSMIGLQGDIGQVLRVIPIVLLMVISVSLIEAFFILPNHLHHTMQQQTNDEVKGLRLRVETAFTSLSERLGRATQWAMQRRYAVTGATVALFLVSVSLMIGGALKFQSFPKLDGDVLQARITMPTGTPISITESHVEAVVAALKRAVAEMEKQETEPLLKHVTVTYGQNQDAFETGAHLATISADLRSAEERNTVLDDLIKAWLSQLPPMPEMQNLVLTEPALGPAGRAIELRLSGLELKELQQASKELEDWLNGYPGVYAVFSDLRPGRPELALTLRPEAAQLGITAEEVASQLRAAYFGIEIDEIYRGLDQLDIVVELQRSPYQSLEEFEHFPIIHPRSGESIPLLSVATITMERDFSRINRYNRRQTATMYGSVNTQITNTSEVVNDTLASKVAQMRIDMPDLRIEVEGEIANGAET
ncbi:MAG: efflux RND transporter permease subunit, partial [Pseudomonadota bacterium]|nr:efflux RND transporter permease subunit [Pseudomonadota bacterium]